MSHVCWNRAVRYNYNYISSQTTFSGTELDQLQQHWPTIKPTLALRFSYLMDALDKLDVESGSTSHFSGGGGVGCQKTLRSREFRHPRYTSHHHLKGNLVFNSFFAACLLSTSRWLMGLVSRRCQKRRRTNTLYIFSQRH